MELTGWLTCDSKTCIACVVEFQHATRTAPVDVALPELENATLPAILDTPVFPQLRHVLVRRSTAMIVITSIEFTFCS